MNLISSIDLSKEDILKLFDIADSVSSGSEEITLKEHATMALIFEAPSTRTRVSLEVAIAKLGGSAIYIDVNTS